MTPPPIQPPFPPPPQLPPPLPPSGAAMAVRFFAALAIGVAVSLAAWGLGFNAVFYGKAGWLIVVVPGVKLVAAIVLLIRRGWRSAGAGLLVSIAVGMLIFFGSCATRISTH